MNVPEFYKWQFQDLIQREYNETLKQIEQIIAHHGKGTYEEEQAKNYIDFLKNILKENNID